VRTIITRTLTADTATITITTVTSKGAVVGATKYVNRADGYVTTQADLSRWVDETSDWLAAGAVWPVEYA
jgi:hypothetical protein